MPELFDLTQLRPQDPIEAVVTPTSSIATTTTRISANGYAFAAVVTITEGTAVQSKEAFVTVGLNYGRSNRPRVITLVSAYVGGDITRPGWNGIVPVHQGDELFIQAASFADIASPAVLAARLTWGSL